MTSQPLGPVVQSFFVDGLLTMKGLRPSSVKSYRDGIRLFLRFIADDARRRITQLTLADITFERVLSFVRHLEEVRHNHARTRNQRLALLHTFFEYLAEHPTDATVVRKMCFVKFRPNHRHAAGLRLRHDPGHRLSHIRRLPC